MIESGALENNKDAIFQLLLTLEFEVDIIGDCEKTIGEKGDARKRADASDKKAEEDEDLDDGSDKGSDEAVDDIEGSDDEFGQEVNDMLDDISDGQDEPAQSRKRSLSADPRGKSSRKKKTQEKTLPLPLPLPGSKPRASLTA